ncbi:DUF1015 family protein [Nanoarchaeota archaeon]
MQINQELLHKAALSIPEIWLPNHHIDKAKYWVPAVDLFGSEPKVWEMIGDGVKGLYSSYYLVYPEVDLGKGDLGERVERINYAMNQYFRRKVLLPTTNGFHLVVHKVGDEIREGLFVTVDLEEYRPSMSGEELVKITDGAYDPSQWSERHKIHPTERTIASKLNARIKVNENASLETTHILMLIDDPSRSVIEPLLDIRKELKVVYDFDLLKLEKFDLDFGHLTGYQVTDPSHINQISQGLASLESQNGAMYWAGDGNHYLASLWVRWVKLKAAAKDKESIMQDPRRYAGVELVNLHGKNMRMYPIHEAVVGVNPDDLLASMHEYFSGKFDILKYKTKDDVDAAVKKLRIDSNHYIPYVTHDGFGIVCIKEPKRKLEVGTLQDFLDKHISPDKINYIHEEETLTKIGQQKDSIGFYLPGLSPNNLVNTVEEEGGLPRKTFALYTSKAKRGNFEARRVV